MINEFEYFAPGTVKEAIELLNKCDDYKIICGGQSLLILLRQGLVQPENLIDIKGISELDYIKGDGKKGLKIGATTTHRKIETSPVIKKSYGILADMENRLASIQTRNWGTIGGNIAHADPAGDPSPVLIVLNSTVTITGPEGERNLPLEDFCLDYFETVMKHGEMLTEIQVPPIPAKTGIAYSKFNVIDTELPTVSAAVAITLGSGEGVCKDVRIALGAAAPVPLRAKKAEEVLRGKKVTESLLKKAGEVASEEADPISDIHASAEYRRELVKVMVKRMGAEALARAK